MSSVESRLVMSASVDSLNSVANTESSVTRSASSNASQSSNGPSYDWVDPSVLKIPTRIRSVDILDQFLSENSFLSPECPSKAITPDICGVTDHVCHSRENALHNFFFVYNTFFADLHITFPFDDFSIGVLRILNVAPTQLHPNSWASLQTFRLLCRIFRLQPTPESFLYYYNTRSSTYVSWLSCI